jgi:hypothetical protein
MQNSQRRVDIKLESISGRLREYHPFKKLKRMKTAQLKGMKIKQYAKFVDWVGE